MKVGKVADEDEVAGAGEVAGEDEVAGEGEGEVRISWLSSVGARGRTNRKEWERIMNYRTGEVNYRWLRAERMRSTCRVGGL